MHYIIFQIFLKWPIINTVSHSLTLVYNWIISFIDMNSSVRQHDGNVIDDSLLKQAIIDTYGLTGSFFHPLDEKIDFNSVTSLRLEFQNILVIENLDSFKNLTKLHLSNNFIRSIDGIQSLTNLKWLDLSFNEIQRIERLEHLIHLEDLCLTHNKIEVLSFYSIHICSLCLQDRFATCGSQWKLKDYGSGVDWKYLGGHKFNNILLLFVGNIFFIYGYWIEFTPNNQYCSLRNYVIWF